VASQANNEVIPVDTATNGTEAAIPAFDPFGIAIH
jgi:YVTN family beta-propeller protein